MQKHINNIIENGTLAQALQAAKELVMQEGTMPNSDQLQAIEDDYMRLQHYMKQGYTDEQREQLYASLRKRLDQIVANCQLAIRHHHSLHIFNQSEQPEEIKNKLQNFVADITLAEQGYNEKQINDIHNEHTTYMDALFQQLYRAPQWTQRTAQFYEQLILSPTIHTNDAQLIVSAISIALINIFDIHKLSLLINVYQQATNEELRQKALVGWALSLHNKLNIYPEIKELLEPIMAKPQTQDEILQLEMQLYLCMNAEKDQQQIQQTIIPNIINNNNLNITPFGITEKEEDQLQNILNPDAEEQAIEEVEKSVKRMMDMQEAGTDIYYGGFTQMKNFPFFQQIANWFRPFDINHPELLPAKKAFMKFDGLQMLCSQDLLCDSDKYSFALALAGMIDKIPENILEALKATELTPNITTNIPSTTLIRRLYLQTLYRFFKLYKDKHLFVNPFQKLEQQHTVYHHKQLMCLCQDTIPQLARFLYKQKEYTELQTLLQNYPDDNNEDIQNIRAYLYIRNREYQKAIDTLQQPTKIPAMQLLAKANYLAERYDQAEILYRQLAQQQEHILSHQLNHARCLIKQKQYQQAEQLLYKLDYNTPNHTQTMQILAWTLLNDHKAEEAIKTYQKIMQQENFAEENLLNAAYAYWVTQQVNEAQTLFRRYIEAAKPNDPYQLLQKAFENDTELLDNYQISSIQRQIMADIVCGNAE